jgi:hypothetical protein
MSWLDALQNYYIKTKSRRNSFPLTSRETTEFNYYAKHEFGLGAFLSGQKPPPPPFRMRLQNYLLLF